MEALFPRSLRSLGSIFDFVSEFVAVNHVEESAAFAVRLAVEELFVNMVKYNLGSTSEIGMDLSKGAGRIVVTFTDSTVEPFDITKVKKQDTRLTLQERRPGGLGIHLVRSVMDEIEYQYHNGRSTITLIKRLGDSDV